MNRRVTTWLAERKNPVHDKEALGHADLATISVSVNPRPHFGFNATAGSIRVALTAGMNEAPRAMSERVAGTMTKVTGSDAVTPNSWLESWPPAPVRR